MKNKIKAIVGSVVAAGVLTAGGTYLNTGSDTSDEASVMALVKKKKNKSKQGKQNYNNQYYNSNNNYRNSSSNGNNRYEEEAPKTDESIMLPKSKRSQDEVLLRRTSYVALYDKQLRIPRWVAWHLTKQHTYGNNSRKDVQFQEDEQVQRPRATNFDYMSSGYDRGHMCPAGDNKWDRQALRESFLFTNCCPQLHSLNSGDWNDLEIQCREWAKKYGDIYIVCGPILRGQQHKTIGKNRVVVPEAFFKVILCMRGTPKAIGFMYNHAGGRHSMSSYVSSVDEVERITGYDFFSSLPDNTEQRIEARADLSEWK